MSSSLLLLLLLFPPPSLAHLHVTKTGLSPIDDGVSEDGIESLVAEAGEPFSISCAAAFAQTRWGSTAKAFSPQQVRRRDGGR